MKLIGLISDTHIPVKAEAIPQPVFEAFHGVDLILHAGDLIHLQVLDELEELAPVEAVHGNMDSIEVHTKFPEMASIQVYNWTIGIIHNLRVSGSTTKKNRHTKQNTFDILVYGHTHRPNIRQTAETLFINPGSPTCPVPPFIAKPTVALLRLTKTTMEPEIITI